MEITKFVAPNSSNTYLITQGKNAVVIDAGGCARSILAKTREADIKIDAVLLTHAHFDHIEDVQAYMVSGIPVYIHQVESEWLNDPEQNLSGAFGVAFVAGAATNNHLLGGETLQFGEIEIETIHTPGHTPGGMCYRLGDCLFSGDTLFKESIGRYDFPQSSGTQLLQGIRGKLLVLPDTLQVYPGHGAETTIGWEKQNNPYLGEGW